MDLQGKLLRDEPDYSRLEGPEYEKVRDLLQKIFVKDPDQRITVIEMLEHPWITNDGEDVISLGLETVTSNDQISEQYKEMV